MERTGASELANSPYRMHEYFRAPWKKMIAARLVQRDGLFCMNPNHSKRLAKKKTPIAPPLFLEINHRDLNPNNPNLEQRILHPELIDLSNLNLYCEICQRGQLIEIHLCKSIGLSVKKENSSLLPTGTTSDKIYHKSEKIYGQAIRFIIQLIQDTWREYEELKRRERDALPGVDAPEPRLIQEVASRLFYGNVVDALVIHFRRDELKQETAYSYVGPLRNPTNGWLYTADMPEGKMLDFKEPLFRTLPVEEVYRRVTS